MKITLRRDPDPKTEFYYHQQFKIYHEPYLIWDRETWEAVLTTCAVYQIDVNGVNAGDVILEEKGKGIFTIVDFGLLPEFQGKGVGRALLNEIMKIGKKLTAVTREETLPFFLKCGFVVKRRIRDYYDRGIRVMMSSGQTGMEMRTVNETRGVRSRPAQMQKAKKYDIYSRQEPKWHHI